MRTAIKLLKDKGGASAIEYALIASLISVAAVASFASVGSGLQSSFNNTADTVGEAL